MTIETPHSVPEQPPKNKRIVGLDVLRGGAVFLVVFHHVLIFLGDKWFQVPGWLATVNWGLGFARMPTLLLLSGFLAQGLVRSSGQRIALRVLNLAWILMLWTPIVLFAKSADGTLDPALIAREIVLPNTELWFLWALNILVLVPLLARQGVSKYVILAVFAVLSVALWSDTLRSSFFAGEQTGRYGLYFVVGCLFPTPSVMAIIRKRAVLLCCCLPAIGLVLHLAKAGEGGSLLYALLSIPEALCFALGAVALVSAIPVDLLLRTHIARLGRNTLPVYVCHIPVIMAFSLIGIRVPPALNAVIAIVAALAVTFICLAVHRVTTICRLTFPFHVPQRLQDPVRRWFDREG